MAHDIFLILAFVLVCDVLEMGKHVYIILNLHGKKSIETTYAICTLSSSLFILHLLSSYVDSFIAIHRFIVRFCGKSVSVMLVYIGIGAVFALKALLLIIVFVQGKVGYGMLEPPTVTCSVGYGVHYRIIAPIAICCLFGSLVIAPILSTFTIAKGLVRKQKDVDTTAFILISSASLGALFIGLIANNKISWNSPLNGVAETFLYTAYTIQDFRFPLLCLIAILVVSDIRGAVLTTVSEAVKKVVGRKKVSFKFEYELCLESGEKIKEIEFDIASLD